jgi:hypothetical protein
MIVSFEAEGRTYTILAVSTENEAGQMHRVLC